MVIKTIFWAGLPGNDKFFKNRYTDGHNSFPDVMTAWDDGACGL
jgi:hypothetical protein